MRDRDVVALVSGVACSVPRDSRGQDVWAHTTVAGWAASFLRAGPGAFIGSLWEVVDTSGSTYAQEFYRAALAGRTLGEAARQGRDAIRDNPGDPTWLAYTLYGDPSAIVRTTNPRGA